MNENTVTEPEDASLRAKLDAAEKALAHQREAQAINTAALSVAHEALAFQNEERAQRVAELIVANAEKAKRAAELVIANEALAFQNEEKAKRVAELGLANEEKAKRAAELVIANEELAFQNEEKAKRVAELGLANAEKAKRAAELVIANEELAFQNEEKAKRVAELIVANEEKAKRAAELVMANEARVKLVSELVVAKLKSVHTEKLQLSLMETIEIARRLCELRDPYTAGHEKKVGDLARAIGTEMGLDSVEQEALMIAGYLHDIGKIVVPVETLCKPGNISPEEYNLVKTHVQASHGLLKEHHERMDGSGYPAQKKGNEISLNGRILAVADVVDAMSSHRPYRAALGIDRALAEIERGRGTLYDATVVDACVTVFRENAYELGSGLP